MGIVSPWILLFVLPNLPMFFFITETLRQRKDDVKQQNKQKENFKFRFKTVPKYEKLFGSAKCMLPN